MSGEQPGKGKGRSEKSTGTGQSSRQSNRRNNNQANQSAPGPSNSGDDVPSPFEQGYHTGEGLAPSTLQPFAGGPNVAVSEGAHLRSMFATSHQQPANPGYDYAAYRDPQIQPQQLAPYQGQGYGGQQMQYGQQAQIEGGEYAELNYQQQKAQPIALSDVPETGKICDKCRKETKPHCNGVQPCNNCTAAGRPRYCKYKEWYEHRDTSGGDEGSSGGYLGMPGASLNAQG